ncbi:Ig-like domain-containing protein [Hyunsoonleella rubra]|uniref:Ig-like domain-containing protein n=1 Tax=Hyunsoonleella rubra TaxID=1737062 RepID=A0ABW5T9X8_9FLAO
MLTSCNKEELYIEKELLQEEEITTEEEEIGENEFSVTLNEDFYETFENTGITIDPSENDGEITTDIILSYTDPSNGVLSIENESVIYTPNDGFTGEDSFVYKVCDGETGLICFEATVTISVLPVEEDDFATELKAFPSAYGEVYNISGGRGGHVYHVTSLADDGSVGTLRWAVNQPRPATIVFDVSGVIQLNYNLELGGKWNQTDDRHDNLTIAGQTAPEGGITLTTANNRTHVTLKDANNVIIRYIRLRMQKDNEMVAFVIRGDWHTANNIILDHVSISYGGLMAIGMGGKGNYNCVIQNSLIAESKTGVLFGDSDPNFQNFGNNNSFNGNLFYNVSHRHPNPNGNGRIDVINNIIHNPFYRLNSNTFSPKLNHINNYVSAGAWTGINFRRMNRAFSDHSTYSQHGPTQIYTSGNIIDNGIFTDADADNKLIWSKWNAGLEDQYAPTKEFVNSMHPLLGSPWPIKTARDAYNDAVRDKDKGASKSLNADGTVTHYNDRHDAEYFSKMAEGEGAYEGYSTYNIGGDFFNTARYSSFIASITGTPINTRPADYDTDRDGMADVWETAKFGDLSRDGKGDEDGDGYTDLEEFLNMVDK